MEEDHQSPKVKEEAPAPEGGGGLIEEEEKRDEPPAAADAAAVPAEEEAADPSSDTNSVGIDEEQANQSSNKKRTRGTESPPDDPEDGKTTGNKRARSHSCVGSASNTSKKRQKKAKTKSRAPSTNSASAANAATISTATASAEDSSSAEDFTCPITLELCVDPVIAEDGHLYERIEIEEHIDNCRKQKKAILSPKTGRAMGPNLIESFTHRRWINNLVSNGTIVGELAETYKQSKMVFDTKKDADRGDLAAMERLAEWYNNGTHGLPSNPNLAEEWNERASDATYIRKLQKAANEDGDAEAMYDLGNAYENGLRGLAEDEQKAYEYYQKSADRKDPAGMALAAYLLDGRGGATKNVVYGVSLMSQAATAGSDFACRELGEWHLYGMHGLPADMDQAKYWLRKATDGKCYMLHLEKKDVEVARECLESLEMSTTKKK